MLLLIYILFNSFQENYQEILWHQKRLSVRIVRIPIQTAQTDYRKGQQRVKNFNNVHRNCCLNKKNMALKPNVNCALYQDHILEMSNVIVKQHNLCRIFAYIQPARHTLDPCGQDACNPVLTKPIRKMKSGITGSALCLQTI